jgi:hypothetical protein
MRKIAQYAICVLSISMLVLVSGVRFSFDTASAFNPGQPVSNSNPLPNALSDVDCSGAGMVPNLSTTITVASSGVGNVTTILQTDGTNTYKTTVDTSVANTTTISCPAKQ